MAYDDFEDGTLDRWTNPVSTGGTAAASTSANKYGSWGCRMTTDGNNDDHEIRLLNVDENIDAGNWYCWVRGSEVTNGAWDYSIWATTSDYIGVFRWWNGTLRTFQGSSYLDFTATLNANTWYRFRITYNATTNKVSFYLYDASNNIIESIVDRTVASGPFTVGSIRLSGFDANAGSYTIDFDNACYTNTSEPGPPPADSQFQQGRKYW